MENPKTTFVIQIVLVLMALVLMGCACIASLISMVSFSQGNFGSASQVDPENILRTIAWTMDMKLYYITAAALFISSVAAFLGWKTYQDLEKVIKARVNSTLEQALYQLDPTYLPIHIYKGRVRRNIPEKETPRAVAREGLPDVDKRLELTGLLNREYVTYLDKANKTGITIIPIDDDEDEAEFIKFVKDAKLKLTPEEAGFILYAPHGYTVKKAQNAFENTTIANMPATVASMVLVVGRGLKNREGISAKKEEKDE